MSPSPRKVAASASFKNMIGQARSVTEVAVCQRCRIEVVAFPVGHEESELLGYSESGAHRQKTEHQTRSQSLRADVGYRFVVAGTTGLGDSGVGTGADDPDNGREQPDRERGQIDGGKSVGTDSADEEGVDEIEGNLKKHSRGKRESEFE